MDVSNEIQQVLDILGEKFGATGDYLWGVMVKQKIAEGILDVSIGIILIILIILGIFIVKGICKKAEKKKWEYEDETKIWLWVSWFIGAGIGIAFAITALCSGMLELYNPEFQALKEILDTFKGV